MAIALDHLILPVNDLEQSLRFYTEVLGLRYVGEREPFSVVQVTEACAIQLAPWGTPGGMHLAFSMTQEEFDDAFGRIRAAGLEFGDAFDRADNMKGPGDADGARGATRSLYCFDPNKHLIEIAHYEDV